MRKETISSILDGRDGKTTLETTLATGNGSPLESPVQRPPRQAWIVVALLSVFMMINFADKAIIGLAGNSMIGLSRVDGGLLQIALIVGSFATGSVMINLGAALIAEISPSTQRGAMLGINNAVYTLAAIGAPWVMGQAVDLGVDAYAGFRSGFAFAGTLILLGGLTAVLLIRPKQDIDRFQQGTQRSNLLDQGQRSAVRVG